MASPERKISVVPSGAEPARPPEAPAAGTEARLASLEDEATRLRAEVDALQDELRWLAEDEEDGGDPAFLSYGLLARGWVRASLLLTAVGLVTVVSVPYFLHLVDPSGRPADPAPLAAAPAAAPVEPAPPVPAPTRPAPRELIPAPARLRAGEIPEPTRVRAEERPGAPRPAVRRERHLAPEPAPSGPTPAHGESP